jgi:hypothetical protein
MDGPRLHHEPSIPDLITLLRETLVKVEALERLPSDEPALIELERQIVLAIAELSVARDKDFAA